MELQNTCFNLGRGTNYSTWYVQYILTQLCMQFAPLVVQYLVQYIQ
jgi:hypothetical protein